jgi:two-component system sensor histidine kinase KdpD
MGVKTVSRSLNAARGPGLTGPEMSRRTGQRAVGAHVALPAAYAGMLVIGTAAAALHGRFSATGVLVTVALLVTVASAVAEPRAAPLLGLVGWLTVVGFSRPPYAQLRLTGPLAVRAAVTLAACSLLAAATGMLARRTMASFRVRIVPSPSGRSPGPGSQPGAAAEERGGAPETAAAWLVPDAPAGLDRRRQVAGVLLAAVVLPLLTAGLALSRRHLSLDDDLLIYLVAVVAVAIVGGFWPAVLAAVAASLLLNWFFTPPLHAFTIDRPENLLALLLFVTVTVAVSSIVHLAARRAGQAARSSREAASLLALAQTVLGGGDTAAAVLDHLTATMGGRAELLEHVGGEWVQIAASGGAPPGAASSRVSARQHLLLVAGQSPPAGGRLLDGFAAQAAAALDRERLRIQAAQAEALAEGNRMRTALLAAVSHDLRTPLASIKASVSTLRPEDVAWTKQDETALLATIEQSADRLNALIGNLLDMGRLSTASLQPFLVPAAVDEVAPLALRGLDQAASVQLLIPDGLPLVRTDPGLLERVLANLFANALAYSPPDRPPVMRAHRVGGTVVLEVTDHGRGVPDEWKQRIFEPFQRMGPNSGTGVGLGLAVAKGLTEAMGASLEAADTPGGGLTMRITLPVAGKTAGSSLLADR